MTSAPTRRPRIYLAGPDVFLPDAAEAFARLKAQCAACGLEGLAPTDTELGADDAGTQEGAPRGADDALAQRIYDGNIRLIQQADGVAANLQAFRGLEPDSANGFCGCSSGLFLPIQDREAVPRTSRTRLGSNDTLPPLAGTSRFSGTATVRGAVGGPFEAGTTLDVPDQKASFRPVRVENEALRSIEFRSSLRQPRGRESDFARD